MTLIIGPQGAEFVPDLIKPEQEDLKYRSDLFETGIADKFYKLREYRNIELQRSDWTVLPDVTISPEDRQNWEEYRQKLRDITTLEGAPGHIQESDWPTSPVGNYIPDNIKELFIYGYSDSPVGIATTSWVGTGSTFSSVFCTRSSEYVAIGTNLIPVTNIDGIEVGDTYIGIGTENVNNLVVSGISSTNVVSFATSTTSDIQNDENILFFRQIDNGYIKQSGWPYD